MELGYGGYPGMQNALRQMMIIRVKEPGNTQKNSEGRSNEKSLSAFLREEAENIYQSAEILEEKTCEAMCNSLKECRSVYLLGLSQVAPFVEYMKSYMRLLHPNVQTITTSHITHNKPHKTKTKAFHASKSYTLFPSIPNHPSHNKTRNKHPPFLNNNNKPITSPFFPSNTTTIPNPTALTFSIDKSITNFMLKTTRLTNTTTTTHHKPSSPPCSDLIHFNSLSKLLINIPKTLPKSKTNLLLTPTTINDNPRTNINNNNN
jgi:hypothetical protein